MAFDYSSRDYATIKSDLLSRARRIAPEWTDRDPSDFGMVLVDLWAQMGDVLHYYVDRSAGEALLPTATQRESVLAFANLFDYTPSGRTSAAGTVTLRNNGTSDVTINPYTKFIARYDESTYQVYAPEGTTIPAGSTATLSVYEGLIINTPAETLTNSASGRTSQRYRLANLNAVRSSLVVTVYEDGVTPTEYRRVDRLSNATAGDRVYAVRATPTGDTEIVFGTEIRGFIPPTGSTITAIYAYSGGSSGNLPANSITAFRDAVPENVTIISSSALTGGVDEETIVSMRRSIPAFASAQNRAVTEFDYVNLALGVDGVSKAAVAFTPNPAGGASAGNASVTVYPQVNRSSDYLTTGETSQAVSSDIQTQVVSALQPRSMLGVDVVCATSITWDTIDLTATVYLANNVVALYTKRDIEDAIDALFSFDNVSFGQTLSLGQFYRAIMNVYGVNYASISVFDNDGAGLEDSITVDPLSLPKKGTVVVTVSGGIVGT